MPTFTKLKLPAVVLSLTVVLSGCVLGGEQAVNTMKEDTVPQTVEYVSDPTALEEEQVSEEQPVSVEEETTAESVMRELFLVDKNGYVVPQSINLPKTKEVAKQALEYLVQNGPITELLPNGFRGVLPPGTEILGLNLKEDGTLIADFSQEFANYRAEDEEKILQAITWTLTQFENVVDVQIRINGHDQPYMPVNGTPVNDGVSRADGINLDNGEVVDMTDSKAVTLYFLAQNGDNTYYVPVTRRIENDSENKYIATVNELIKGPNHNSGLVSEFHPDIKLLNAPVYENGVVTLNFNESILGDLQGTALSKQLLDSLVLSLTEQEGVESVAVQVNGDSKVFNEMGDELTEPVSRPEMVNTGSF